MFVSEFNVDLNCNKQAVFLFSKCSWLPKRLRNFLFNWLSSFEQKKYDEVISLGANCVTAMTLRHWGLRKSSYPFDWIAKYDLFDRFLLINNRFEGFLNFEDLEFEVRHGKYYATNRRTSYVMPHDFGKYSDGVPYDRYKDVDSKYGRRIDRLYKNAINKRILMIYFEVDDENLMNERGIRRIEGSLIEIKNKLQASQLDLLFFHGDEKSHYCPVRHYRNEESDINCFFAAYNKQNFEGKEWGALYNELGIIIKAICTRD